MMDIQLLVTLWAGHYLADFGLQSRFMATSKRLVFIESIGFHLLTAHAFIHGLIAGFIAQDFTTGLVVGATHWLIDFTRSSVFFRDFLASKKIIRRKVTSDLYNIHIDQLLHFLVILAVAWRLS